MCALHCSTVSRFQWDRMKRCWASLLRYRGKVSPCTLSEPYRLCSLLCIAQFDLRASPRPRISLVGDDLVDFVFHEKKKYKNKLMRPEGIWQARPWIRCIMSQSSTSSPDVKCKSTLKILCSLARRRVRQICLLLRVLQCPLPSPLVQAP